MQASRPRNTHTAVAIKKARHTPVVNLPRATPPAYRRCHHVARHTPTAHLRPSHTTPRHSKPSGYTMAHPSCQTSQTSQTGQTQAPRPRRLHTAVAIKKAYLTGKSAPRQIAPQTAHRRCHQTVEYVLQIVIS